MNVDSKDVDVFLDSICELAKVNRLTGLWDHIRFEEAKKDLHMISLETMYFSEKNSRKNVESRAIQRKKIDQVLQKLINSLNE